MTPFINAYAAFFLIGGAAVSAWRFWQRAGAGNRAAGNTLIAVGALLPGIGGAMAKAGVVEALYVGEFIGLVLIWAGERMCAWRPAPAAIVGEPGPVPWIDSRRRPRARLFRMTRFRSCSDVHWPRRRADGASWRLLAAARRRRAGDIVGTAADATGAVLPAAQVTLRNLATGEEQFAQADLEGRFRFAGIRVGSYLVTVESAGFSRDSRTVTVADAGAPVEVTFALVPGRVEMGVTVTATRSERDAAAVPLRTDTIGRDALVAEVAALGRRRARPGAGRDAGRQRPDAGAPAAARPRFDAACSCWSTASASTTRARRPTAPAPRWA